ncbi:hypothetical protein GRO01_24870 [Gluconobacter roseus NBRC 3990]|uniref:LysM domain-containing protein n=2 Tax=Gluconobacter roseus TaxID=586239 RepID=A0A4Y3MCB6_9PROT|nr:hypothetical protein AD943_01385 [Gluconobacter roseus]GEB04911.1 hypothetical protein GRO01_24870 [Gluconobacter roseus NBRC 3990]GLP94543.1 hypothetical protein GCM10007871_25210 [Gluconobacter roseus NBRC 3990]
MQDIIVSAADISLFHVAARELGDASQWWRIAQVNGMTDPDLGKIPETVVLKVPSVERDLVSGLPDGAGS